MSAQLAPPTKQEESLEAFIKSGSLITYEANAAYGDTCLHSTVPELRKAHGIQFNHETESVMNRWGRKRPVTRYTPINMDKVVSVYNMLRVKRGAKPIQEVQS